MTDERTTAKPAALPPIDADEIARTLLESVQQRPDDEAAHLAFLEYCATSNQIPFAARNYRESMRKQPKWDAVVAVANLDRSSSGTPYRTSIALLVTFFVLVALLATIPMCLRSNGGGVSPSKRNSTSDPDSRGRRGR